MANFKAVIFDMDGVLIDAKEWHYLALNRALKLFGYEIPLHRHIADFDGLPTRKKLEMLSIERGLPRGLHFIINELKQQYTLELVHAHCKPRFIHEYALSRLKALGYKLALASNAVKSSVEIMMSKSNLAQYLDVVLSNEDVRAAKPAPDIYLAASNKLGTPPAECMVVEDNENGIMSAEAAGMHVMVVSNVEEVSLSNILKAMDRIEKGHLYEHSTSPRRVQR